MICCVSVAPRPPYSFGQLSPTHPPACIFLCHSTRRFQSSELLSRMRSPPSSSLFPNLGRLALSQLLNSARNASSSALNLKSIDASAGDRDAVLLAALTMSVSRRQRSLTLVI